jgi:drug/metabolite transporter (DMT)-like permease
MRRQHGFTPRSGLATLVALFYILLWSSAFIATKVVVSNGPPLTVLAARFLLASMLLALLARARRLRWPEGVPAWGRLALFGVLNSALYLGFTYEAQRYLSAGMGSIISATNPLVLTLLATRFLGERLTPAKFIGLCLGFTGVLFVMVTRVGTGRADSVEGVALALCGVVCLSCATMLYKRWPLRQHPLVVNTVQLGAAGLVLVIPALLSENVRAIRLDRPLLQAGVYLVLVISIGASLLWFWLLERGEASAVSAYYFLTPVFGLALAAILLGEPFGVREAAGLLATAVGIGLINRPPGPHAVAVPAQPVAATGDL